MKFLASLILFMTATWSAAQETQQFSTDNIDQLEAAAAAGKEDREDDSYVMQQDVLRRHPLSLNAATAEELKSAGLLTDLQIDAFLLYRRLLGKIISVYELQAVPSWDLPTIRNLLPYITLAENEPGIASLLKRLSGGDRLFIARYGRVMEKSIGYVARTDSSAAHYQGSPDKLYFRYTYNFKNQLQWGVLGDKDAGEQFFRGKQRLGFDFYSFHFFIRQAGRIKALALGDFGVNMGQGLLQWQTLSAGKSGAVMNIKQQAAVLRPYTASGEYDFHRGAGITLQLGKWEVTGFVSLRALSSGTGPDSLPGSEAGGSLLTSGYNRSTTENAHRNNTGQLAAGSTVVFQSGHWHAAVNLVHDHFSKSLQPAAEPYNLFAFRGRSLTAFSTDGSFTWRNVHVFAEVAADDQLHPALVAGAVSSLDPKLDVAFLYRHISRAYRSFNAAAFTEGSHPVNETGWYTGILLRPFNGLLLSAYADFYHFPWLRYRVSAPSPGQDYLCQADYTPDRQTTIQLRYKNEHKWLDAPAGSPTQKLPGLTRQSNLRLQVSVSVNREISFRYRAELGWYRSEAVRGEGWLTYLETNYAPGHKSWRANVRMQYFKTTGFEERLYTYEPDLPYSFSIPFYYGHGYRYFVNLKWDASKWLARQFHRQLQVACWLKWARTAYPGQSQTGSSYDVIQGDHKSEIRVALTLKK